MRPDQCGTFGIPDGTQDREVVDQVRDLLREMTRRGRDAVLADPAWQPYLSGTGPAPARCAVCGAPSAESWQHEEIAPGLFLTTQTGRECSADPTHKGGEPVRSDHAWDPHVDLADGTRLPVHRRDPGRGDNGSDQA